MFARFMIGAIKADGLLLYLLFVPLVLGCSILQTENNTKTVSVYCLVALEHKSLFVKSLRVIFCY